MKTRDFRWPFLFVLVLILIIGNVVEPTNLGISTEWSSGEGYRFAGGTAVWALGISLVIGTLYLWLMYADSYPTTKPLSGIFRRWIAFWIDFILAIMAITPIFGLIPMFAEWKRTRVFAWNFARTVPQSGDALVSAITTGLGIVAILGFFAFPLFRNRPSPGSCVAGYQVSVVGDIPLTLRRAVLRTLLGFVAAVAPYLAPFLSRNRPRGQFWLDKVFGTQAVKLN